MKKNIFTLLVILYSSLFFSLHATVLSHFILPEDDKNLILFLEKILTHKRENITIITQTFTLSTLIRSIAHNPSLHLKLYTATLSKEIQKLALYKHVTLFICPNIKQTSIQSNDFLLSFRSELTPQALHASHETISKLPQKSAKKLKNCTPY